MTKVAILFMTLLLISTMSRVAMAQDLEPTLTQHPDPARSAYYREHAADIQNLRTQVMQGEPAQRLESLEQLLVKYPDAAFNTAIDLLDDDTLDIALKAAKLLSAKIAMSDHQSVSHDHNLNPYQEYAIAQHDAARTALLSVLDDPRAELRAVAAGTLSSLSEEDALRQIDAGVQNGLYSDVEAVNYFGLANPEIADQYLEPYLNAGSNEARSGAVMYLGSNPKYQLQIRDSILLNSELDPSIRSAASNSLSIYDPNYQSYALILTLDPTLPSSLYTTVIEGYIESLQADNELNSTQAGVLRTAVENYQTLNPEVNIEKIESSLEQYGE